MAIEFTQPADKSEGSQNHQTCQKNLAFSKLKQSEARAREPAHGELWRWTTTEVEKVLFLHLALKMWDYSFLSLEPTLTNVL